MKNHSSLPLLISALSAFLMFEAFTAFAQEPMRPTPPTSSRIRRPTSPNIPPPNGAPIQKAITQPSGDGTTPVIPYDDSPNALNFQEASVDLVIMEYALRTGRTVIKAPGVPAINITLRTTPDSPLDDKQYLMAIEQVLNLNGIALEPVGDKFLKVLPSAEYRKHAPKTIFTDPKTGEPVANEEDGHFVSQMIELKYIDIAEAQSVITGFVRTGAQIQTIERTNSILVTDSADTVNRIVEVLKYIDKPIIAREEPNIIQVRYAKAADVKTRIEEIIKDAQEQDGKATKMSEERASGAPGTVVRQLPAGVTLPRRDRESAEASKGTETFEALVADAQRGVIRGKVSIIADERTNILIIITRPENMVFFKSIIDVLDVPTAPEVVVEVHRLEHAVAEDVATILNDLIGNKKAAENDAKNPAGKRDSDAKASNDSANDSKAAPERTVNTGKSSLPAGSRTKVGQLDSENIKILADERTNAILIMGNYADMVTIRDIIKQMDIMLSQVAIEIVIISLNFKDGTETGIDWVQRAMLAGKSADGTGPAMGFASAGGGGTLTPESALTKTTTDTLSGYGAGATFLTTVFDFNLDVIIHAVKTDSRARLMNQPIITTLDNKEAVLESTERIYYTEGTTYYNDSANTTKNIKNEDIGVKLKVTPRINKNGYIVLTIEQEWQDLGSGQVIDGENLPTVNTRKMGSDVAVQSGETVILGGLASNAETLSHSKIPILGDIPLLGWFFRSSTMEKSRNEIVIFLTPRVLDTPGQIEDETRNRKANLDTDGIWDSGWSNSRVADPLPEADEKKLIERGRKTVAPPRYPLTRHLTTLNDEYGLTPEVAPSVREGSRYPYSHFSDIKKINPEETPSEEESVEASAEPIEKTNVSTEKTGSVIEPPASPTNGVTSPVKSPAVTEPKTQPAPVAKIVVPEKKSDVVADPKSLPAEPPVAKALMAAKPATPVNAPVTVTNVVPSQPLKPASKAPASQPVDEAINAILKP